VDANSFLKRIALFAILTALPTFANASPPGGGGHSSRGGGGHSAGGGRGGGGHAFVGGRGHSVGGRGQAIGGRGQAIGGRGQAIRGRGQAVIAGRSSAGMHADASTIRRGAIPVANTRSFLSDPSGRGDWRRGPGDWKHGRGDWKQGTAWHRGDRDRHHHRHRRVSFGFFPYWYPTGGYYSYGYPGYPYDYYDYYDYSYPDNGYYSGQSESASIQVLVQQALASRGYYAGALDGLVGPETQSAIREFQRDYGLPVTGDINSELIQALKIG
jgi:Putative peptidoglycan binding domain